MATTMYNLAQLDLFCLLSVLGLCKREKKKRRKKKRKKSKATHRFIYIPQQNQWHTDRLYIHVATYSVGHIMLSGNKLIDEDNINNQGFINIIITCKSVHSMASYSAFPTINSAKCRHIFLQRNKNNKRLCNKTIGDTL